MVEKTVCQSCKKLVKVWTARGITFTVAHKRKSGQYCNGGYLPVDKKGE